MVLTDALFFTDWNHCMFEPASVVPIQCLVGRLFAEIQPTSFLERSKPNSFLVFQNNLGSSVGFLTQPKYLAQCWQAKLLFFFLNNKDVPIPFRFKRTVGIQILPKQFANVFSLLFSARWSGTDQNCLISLQKNSWTWQRWSPQLQIHLQLVTPPLKLLHS